MTKAKIDWLLPSTPESLLMLDDPVEGLRPKWLPPGVTGDVLQIDAMGNLAWGVSPATLTFPLRAPDGTVDAPSYGFDSLQGTGMMRNADFPEGDLTFVVKGEPVTTLYSYGPFGIMALIKTTLTFAPDNSADIGIGGGNPRNIYAGTSFRAPDGTAAAPSYAFATDPTTGFLYSGGSVYLAFSGQSLVSFFGYPDVIAMMQLGPSAALSWEAGEGLALNSSDGPITLRVGGAERWEILTTGMLRPIADAAYDLGDATHQIRDLYLSGAVKVNGVPLGGIEWPLRAPNGTQAAPSYAFVDDPGTGITRHALGGGELGFIVGGVQGAWLAPGQFVVASASMDFYPGNTRDIGGNHKPRHIYAGTSFRAPDGTEAAPAYSFAADPDSGFAMPYAPGIGVTYIHNGTPRIHLGQGVIVGSGGEFAFCDSPSAVTNIDVRFARIGPGVVALAGGGAVVSTSLRINGDADTYLTLGGQPSYVDLSAVGGTLILGTSGANSILFYTQGAYRWNIDTVGTFFPNVDAVTDIGGTSRQVRNLYLSGQIVLNGVPQAPLSNPMTTAADLIVGGSTGTPTRLAKGATVGHVLTVTGASSLGWMAAPGTVGSVGWPLLAPDGTQAAPSYAFASDPDTGMYLNGPNTLGFVSNGALGALLYADLLAAQGRLGIGFAFDVILARDGPGILAQRNGAANQVFRLYETTDGTNKSWLEFGGYDSMHILTRTAGAAASRAMRVGTDGAAPLMFVTSGQNRWYMESNGYLFPLTDNALDFGAPSYRPRSIYVGTSFLAPDGSAAAPSYSFATQTTTGFYYAGGIVGMAAGTRVVSIAPQGLLVDCGILTIRDVAGGIMPGVTLVPDANNILAQKNGANGQEFRVYKDAATNKYLSMVAAGTYNFLSSVGSALGINAIGAGNVMFFGTDGGSWYVWTDGNLLPAGSYDIGSASLQVRDLYLGGAVKFQNNKVRISPTELSPNMGLMLQDERGAYFRFYSSAPDNSIFVWASVGGSTTSMNMYGWASGLTITDPVWYVAASGVYHTNGTPLHGHPGKKGTQVTDWTAGHDIFLEAGTTPNIALPNLATAPATPPAGYTAIYMKADKKAYQKNDAGLETLLGGGSAVGVAVVPLWLENARFPDGSANNAFPMPVERISTGTPASGVPKLVEMTYQFDAATQEFLVWKGNVPQDYAGGAVTLVAQWSMLSATSGNIRLSGALGCVVESSTDARALITPAPTVSADQAVPGTLGQQKETRLALTGLTNVVAGRKFVATLSLYAGSASSAAGDRVLESAWLEFARS